MYEMEIPIIIDKDLVTYEYDSSARGFHVYMDIWNPVIGDILKCKREPTNEVDKHAVAIMCSDSLGKSFSHWTHSLQYFEIFIHVSHNPVHCNRSRSVRQKSQPWKWLWTRNSSEISVLWPRKTHPMVGQKIRSSKKRTRM